jgi:hypothetical protein
MWRNGADSKGPQRLRHLKRSSGRRRLSCTRRRLQLKRPGQAPNGYKAALRLASLGLSPRHRHAVTGCVETGQWRRSWQTKRRPIRSSGPRPTGLRLPVRDLGLPAALPALGVPTG